MLKLKNIFLKSNAKIIFIVFILFIIVSRFYNLEHTARFTEDESGFLVRVHQIYRERKLTLVGQINESGTKVFSSTTVYLLLPFAIIGDFSPVSVFYGAAFWGVITAIVLLYLIKLVNRRLVLLSGILISIWFPILQMGRWAWNPNFIPLWVGAGIICYFSKRPLFWLFGGIFLGLASHQHYWAIFATSVFVGLIILEGFLKKKLRKGFYYAVGVGLTLAPFIIFDFRHPPGLFILGAGQQAGGLNVTSFIPNIIDYLKREMYFFTQSVILSYILLVLVAVNTIMDLKKRSKAMYFLMPAIFQVVAITFIGSYYPHYFFAAIPFFLVWLFYPRTGIQIRLQHGVIAILFLGSILTFFPLLTRSPVEPDLGSVTKISNIIINEIQSNELKNVNIAVLASGDHNTFGRKYRDILLVNNNIQIKTPGEYDLTDNLFVISQSDEQRVRIDPAYEISNFRNGDLKAEWKIANSNWVVYRFSRNPN